jgi:hypothetical protein
MFFCLFVVVLTLAQNVLVEEQRVALNEFYDGIGCPSSLCRRLDMNESCPNNGKLNCVNGSVTEIDFVSNPLSYNGTISTVIGRLTALTALFMTNLSNKTSSVSGSVPTELGLLSQLQQFNLINQNVTGTLPTQVRKPPLSFT